MAAKNYLTSTSTNIQLWTVPTGWDSANNSVVAIGPGGNGSARGGTSAGGRGGGGGSFGRADDITLTAGKTCGYLLPAGGGAVDCWFIDLNQLKTTSTFGGSWGGNDVTRTATQTDPDSGTKACKITEGTSSTIHGIYQFVTKPASVAYSYCVRCTFKSLDTTNRPKAILSVENGNVRAGCVIDLTNGTSADWNQNFGTFSNLSYTVTSKGNGWYQAVMSVDIGSEAGTSIALALYNTNSAGDFLITGTGADATAYYQPSFVFGNCDRGYWENTSGSTILAAALGRYGTNATTTVTGVSQTGSQGAAQTYQGGNGAANSGNNGGGGGGAAGWFGVGGAASTTTGGSASGGRTAGSTSNTAGAAGNDFETGKGAGSGAGGTLDAANTAGRTGGAYGGGGSGSDNSSGSAGGTGGQALIAYFMGVTLAVPTKAITVAAQAPTVTSGGSVTVPETDITDTAEIPDVETAFEVSFKDSTSLSYASRTNSTIDKPTAAATGDTCIIICFGENDSAATALAVTGPTGFTAHSSNPFNLFDDGSGHSGSLNVFYRTLDGSEDDTFTLTHATNPTEVFCGIWLHGDVDSAAPILSDDSGADGPNNDIATSNTLTTTTNFAGIISFGYGWNGVSGAVPTTGDTMRYVGTVLFVSTHNQDDVGESAEYVTLIPNNGQGRWAANLLAVPLASTSVVNVPAIAITVTAEAPSVATGEIISIPNALAITVAKQTPSVSSGGSVEVPAKAITVAAQAPTIVSGGAVVVPATAITVSTQTPLINAQVFIPATAVTVATATPTIVSGGAVVVPAKAITVAAQTPSIASGGSVAVPATALTVTVEVPDISIVNNGVVLDLPVAGEITVATATPTIVSGGGVAVPAKAVTVSAQTPLINAQVFVPAKAITVSAQAPTILSGGAVVVPATTITIAAQAPTFDAGVNLAIPATDFTVDAPEPTISSGVQVFIDATGFDVVAYAPEIVSGANIFVGAPSVIVEAIPPLHVGVGVVAIQIPAYAFTVQAYPPHRAGFVGEGNLQKVSITGEISTSVPITGILDRRVE
jgi:hypothetical protein